MPRGQALPFPGLWGHFNAIKHLTWIKKPSGKRMINQSEGKHTYLDGINSSNSQIEDKCL
jgi:hypothetical protein